MVFACLEEGVIHILDLLGWWMYLITFCALFHLKVKVVSTLVSLPKHLQNSGFYLCYAWWYGCDWLSGFLRPTTHRLFDYHHDETTACHCLFLLQVCIVSLVVSVTYKGIIWFWRTVRFLLQKEWLNTTWKLVFSHLQGFNCVLQCVSVHCDITVAVKPETFSQRR